MTRRLAARLSALLFAVGVLFSAGAACGHELDTALLSLNEVAVGRFVVHWQVNSYTLEKQIQTPATFPQPCKLSGPNLECGPSGLVGSIEFPWLRGRQTQVMVDIEWRSGSRLLRVITGRAPSLTVYGVAPSAGLRFLKPIVLDYTRLGIEHILTGFDHLLFVVALTLLVRNGARLVTTITAFTIAHSLTLACSVLGLVQVPSAPVEAAIALSIVLVCAECLRPADSLIHRAPWAVSFAFGLLHGLGFASSLLAIGLPEQHVPAALLCFNVGVELGQLGVIALVTALRLLAARLGLQSAWAGRSLIYAMGAIAAFWSLERVVAVFGT